MPRITKTAVLIALALILALSSFACISEEAEKKLVFINRTGASIAEFYFASESSAKLGACRNPEWIKADGEITLTFKESEIAEGAYFKARIGVYRSGKVQYVNFDKIDLLPMLETGFAVFMPEKEGSTVISLLPAKKEFFHFSNTTTFTINSIALVPSGSSAPQDNRLNAPLLPGETVKIQMTYEEVMQDTMWNLRMGIDKDGEITYFTLQSFPLDKLTGCECVILKPYKDSCSFHYSNDPIE